MSNKDSWNSADLVNAYVNEHALQKPEETILGIVKDKLNNWRMLDLGIGLGRTTLHFAPLVKEYVGTDYSFGMIKTYQKLFPETNPNVQVRLSDARMMQEFESGYFDFILFSFNGIDYISHEDRIDALKEVKRIGKKGGLFVFSTHNLQYVDNLYTIKLHNGLRYSAYQCYRYFRLIYENGFPGKYRDKDFAILNDGAHHFKLNTYYIKPAAQVEQLERLGFKNIRLFSLKTGGEVEKARLNGAGKDSWIYYLCEI
ncbi:MAG: class I SAM-dependent methyltransferase [Lewinellaceae bacterium]|jgi:ubiquinone/menaquinone biosynthesis C-methylase UbiE|nr:class I SAM-dependent methyltransferase [Lewinellaceae bacterium]